MQLFFVNYEDKFLDSWDSFVKNESRNGTIFHEQKFLSYHPEDRFHRFDKICYNQKNEILAVIPGIIATDDGKKKYVSHLGSTAGGVIYSKHATTREVLSILDSFILLLKNESVESAEFRIHEPFFSSPHHGELEYCLWYTGFSNVSKELSTVFQLAGQDTRFVSKRTMSYIKSLEKRGFLINRDDSVAETYNLIKLNLEKRYNKKPTHSLEELEKLKKIYPDRIHFWTVRHPVGLNILSAVVVFEASSHALHDFYIAQDYENPESAHTLNLLFHTAFKYYREKGFLYYNFGISSRNKEVKWGILEFKEKAGGRAISRDIWLLSNLEKYKSVIQNVSNG